MSTKNIINNTLPADASTFTLAELIPKKREIYFKKGQSAFSSFDTIDSFYFIIDGKIKISQINPDTAKEQTINILSKGDMFDVVTLLDGGEHEYISTTLEDSKVVEVPIDDIRNLIETNPSFNRFFFPYLAKQMRQMEDLAVDLSLYDVYSRLLRLISRNVDKTKDISTLKLINDLSHEELASLVGSVRKVVNRSLQKLKSEGIIELSRKSIKLKNLQQLLEKLKY